MKKIVIFFLFSGLCNSAEVAFADKSLVKLVDSSTELTANSIIWSKKPYEISGSALDAKSKALIFVADNDSDLAIYQVPFKPSTKATVSVFMQFSDLSGFAQLQSEASKLAASQGHGRSFDLEGLARCQDTLYFANERTRQIGMIESGQIRWLNIGLHKIPELMAGGANAGLEGVAVDCVGQKMWVAKEREPRLLVEVDLKNKKVVSIDSWPGSSRSGRRAINDQNGKGLINLEDDASDLFFDKGALYVLERNNFEIARMNPSTKKIEERVSFFMASHDLFQQFEPFGQAEALVLTPSDIWIGFDAPIPVSYRSKKRYGIKGRGSLWMRFERPSQF